MRLTNQQIDDAILALEAFNPACHFRTKMRLNRNLRKLLSARQDKEHDRIRLTYSVVKDKSRKSEANGSIQLTAEEAVEAQDAYKRLMKTEVEVEIHPVEIYDGEAGQKPKDPELAIDLSKVPLDNRILTSLLDVVFGEVD